MVSCIFISDEYTISNGLDLSYVQLGLFLFIYLSLNHIPLFFSNMLKYKHPRKCHHRLVPRAEWVS